jgi:hypothetical protein
MSIPKKNKNTIYDHLKGAALGLINPFGVLYTMYQGYVTKRAKRPYTNEDFENDTTVPHAFLDQYTAGLGGSIFTIAQILIVSWSYTNIIQIGIDIIQFGNNVFHQNTVHNNMDSSPQVDEPKEDFFGDQSPLNAPSLD